MKHIPLTKGLTAIIDDCDFDLISQFKWCANKANYNAIYAVRGEWCKENKKTLIIAMHRLIAGAKHGQQVDHINGNKLDNRRSNLRLCTGKENQRNMRPRKSGVKGIHFTKARKHLSTPWQAYITVDRKKKHLGYFHSLEEAQSSYNFAANELFGDFAKTVNI